MGIIRPLTLAENPIVSLAETSLNSKVKVQFIWILCWLNSYKPQTLGSIEQLKFLMNLLLISSCSHYVCCRF